MAARRSSYTHLCSGKPSDRVRVHNENGRDNGALRIHVNAWNGLNHFLAMWADSEHVVPERRQFVDLPLDERAIWSEAVEYYSATVLPLSSFGDERIALKAALSNLPTDSPTVVVEPIPGIARILERAMTVYRRRWWPAHHAAALAWVEDIEPLVRRYESDFARRIASAFGGHWPNERLRVDVGGYANWAGAYTTYPPNHTVVGVATLGLEGEQALELLFHSTSQFTPNRSRLRF